jgi:hypothetical protein
MVGGGLVSQLAKIPLSHWEPDPAGYTASFAVLDRAIHANLGRYTLGLSPRAMVSAYFDWIGGIVFSPGKQAQLVHKAQRKWTRYLSHVQGCLLDPEGGADTCFPIVWERCLRNDAGDLAAMDHHGAVEKFTLRS